MDMGDTKSVAIVTGASQGIGRATAIRLARDFEAVVLAARQEDELAKSAAEVKSAGGERPHDRSRSKTGGRRAPHLCARFAAALLGRDTCPGHARSPRQNRRSREHCR